MAEGFTAPSASGLARTLSLTGLARGDLLGDVWAAGDDAIPDREAGEPRNIYLGTLPLELEGLMILRACMAACLPMLAAWQTESTRLSFSTWPLYKVETELRTYNRALH